MKWIYAKKLWTVVCVFGGTEGIYLADNGCDKLSFFLNEIWTGKSYWTVKRAMQETGIPFQNDFTQLSHQSISYENITTFLFEDFEDIKHSEKINHKKIIKSLNTPDDLRAAVWNLEDYFNDLELCLPYVEKIERLLMSCGREKVAAFYYLQGFQFVSEFYAKYNRRHQTTKTFMFPRKWWEHKIYNNYAIIINDALKTLYKKGEFDYLKLLYHLPGVKSYFDAKIL